MGPSVQWGSRPIHIMISGLMVLVGLSYLLTKSVLLLAPTDDYQFIWLAGTMWNDGLDPYSEEYGRLGIALFEGVYPPKVWFYPPSWWPIATLTALTSFETGIVIWRGTSALCLIVGVHIVLRAYGRFVAPVSVLRAAAFFAFACIMSATPMALWIGQTSFLSFLGAALFISAYLGDRRVLMICALFLLMLKPQIGLPFCFFLLARRAWWPSLVAGAVVSVLASMPALAISGLGSFLKLIWVSFLFMRVCCPIIHIQ